MLTLYILMLDDDIERNKFSILYENHKYVLLRYAIKYVGSQNLAEDAVHNAFISIIHSKDKYLALSNHDFIRAAVVIVRNKCIDILRYQKKIEHKPLETLEIYLESEELPIDEQVFKGTDYELIRMHLNAIDVLSRQVLIMKYVQNMTYNEIGDALGMKPKHVGTRIMRAKAKVRELLEKDVMYNG